MFCAHIMALLSYGTGVKGDNFGRQLIIINNNNLICIAPACRMTSEALSYLLYFCCICYYQSINQFINVNATIRQV